MPPAVIADRGADLFRYLTQIPYQLINPEILKRSVTLYSCVQFVHIGLMMLGMVYFHSLRIKIWFKRIIRIRQIRKFVTHGISSLYNKYRYQMITDMSNRWTDGTDNFPLTILSRTRS